jgi:hypothetical protein
MRSGRRGDESLGIIKKGETPRKALQLRLLLRMAVSSCTPGSHHDFISCIFPATSVPLIHRMNVEEDLQERKASAGALWRLAIAPYAASLNSPRLQVVVCTVH